MLWFFRTCVSSECLRVLTVSHKHRCFNEVWKNTPAPGAEAVGDAEFPPCGQALGVSVIVFLAGALRRLSLVLVSTTVRWLTRGSHDPGFRLCYHADTRVSVGGGGCRCICCLLKRLSVYAGTVSEPCAAACVLARWCGICWCWSDRWDERAVAVPTVSAAEAKGVTALHHRTLLIIFWPCHSCWWYRAEATSHLLFFSYYDTRSSMFYAHALTDILSLLWCVALGGEIFSCPA